MKKLNILLFSQQGKIVQAIQSAADHEGFVLVSYASPADLNAQYSKKSTIKNRPGEPTKGEDSNHFAAVVDYQPALIFVDLDNLAINWKKWLPILKSSPATRRMPIVAWAKELSADTKAVARSRGAEIAISEEVLLRDVRKIIQKKARRIDHEAIATACQEPLSELAIKGLKLFNQGEYYDCHEELEHAWNEDSGPAKELYRGVLQVAVAYLQIERGNYNGAIKMLMRVRQWLDPLPDVCRGINVKKLREDAEAVHAQVRELGREQIGEFDLKSFQPVDYTT